MSFTEPDRDAVPGRSGEDTTTRPGSRRRSASRSPRTATATATSAAALRRGEHTAGRPCRDGRSAATVLRRWPSVLGLAAAVFLLTTGVNREAVAVTIGAATLCYLGAAATNKPWTGWAGILGSGLVVIISESAGLPWWAGIGIAAVALVLGGLIGGVPRLPLTAQTAALLGFGGLAVAGLFAAPRVGLAVAGTALAAHAVWDLIHYRRDRVVPRSLAEFCILLDVPLGLGAVISAIIGW